MLLITCITNSQESQDISGKIIDEKTECSVENLKIKIKHINSDERFITETNENGNFNFSNIPIGKYNLSIHDKDYIKSPFLLLFVVNTCEHSPAI